MTPLCQCVNSPAAKCAHVGHGPWAISLSVEARRRVRMRFLRSERNPTGASGIVESTWLSKVVVTFGQRFIEQTVDSGKAERDEVKDLDACVRRHRAARR